MDDSLKSKNNLCELILHLMLCKKFLDSQYYINHQKYLDLVVTAKYRYLNQRILPVADSVCVAWSGAFYIEPSNQLEKLECAEAA